MEYPSPSGLYILFISSAVIVGVPQMLTAYMPPKPATGWYLTAGSTVSAMPPAPSWVMVSSVVVPLRSVRRITCVRVSIEVLALQVRVTLVNWCSPLLSPPDVGVTLVTILPSPKVISQVDCCQSMMASAVPSVEVTVMALRTKRAYESPHKLLFTVSSSEQAQKSVLARNRNRKDFSCFMVFFYLRFSILCMLTIDCSSVSG